MCIVILLFKAHYICIYIEARFVGSLNLDIRIYYIVNDKFLSLCIYVCIYIFIFFFCILFFLFLFLIYNFKPKYKRLKLSLKSIINKCDPIF